MTLNVKEQIKESYGYVIYDPETNAYYCAPVTGSGMMI